LALGLVRTQLGADGDQAQFSLTQYLSTRKGTTELARSTDAATEQLNKLATSCRLSLKLTISAKQNTFFGHDPFAQIAFALLDQRLPAQMAAISYFPADRAFPLGEVNIQIGSGDAAAQVQSHIGTPAAKYSRLKQTIVHGIITNQINKDWLATEFNYLLENLVPGKKLSGLSINQLGQLKVLIGDASTGKIFDIDSMSSGEKGIILIFLLIRHTLAEGGLLLIDEPELHLNPAVSKKVLPFLVEHCVKLQKLQAFICTHSPEILGAAFDREDTNLFHLRSGNDLTKVYRRDQAEMFEALRRLGASPADVLFSRGTIVVEGEHDAEILNEGFFDLVSGYKTTRAGGRSEVAKEIVNLQAAERRGEVKKPTLAILDLDGEPVAEKSTTLVRVLQWDRYCLENYLIEPDLLFDLIREVATRKPESRGSFSGTLKPMAMQQLLPVAIREVYATMSPENPGIRGQDISGKNIEEISALLVARLLKIKDQTKSIDEKNWKMNFSGSVESKIKDLGDTWELDWAKRCSGKRLIQDLYREHQINIDPLTFKKRLIRQMRSDKTDGWRLIESRIRGGLL
jgi:ABC-type molybdenum transport system ATPase subunit/photorepair protein PhrA